MEIKNIICVNGKAYHSYKNLCTDLDIDYKRFMKLKCENHDFSEMELLSCFYDDVFMKMSDDSYLINPNKKKF